MTEPRNPSELRRALVIKRPGQRREIDIWSSKQVYSNRQSVNDHVFEINVHPESELLLRVHTGLPFLKLMRGTSANVKVEFTSVWGNSLEIFPEQGASVSVPYGDTKVTLTGDGRDLKIEKGDKKLSRDRYREVGNFTHTDPEVIERIFETRHRALA